MFNFVVNHEAAVVLLYAVSIIGMLAHFYKKKLRRQTLDDLRTYIFSHIPSTLNALGAAIGVSTTAIAALPDGPIAAPALWTALLAVFGTSYAADSALNKASDADIKP
jgi:hypothetical protein